MREAPRGAGPKPRRFRSLYFLLRSALEQPSPKRDSDRGIEEKACGDGAGSKSGKQRRVGSALMHVLEERVRNSICNGVVSSDSKLAKIFSSSTLPCSFQGQMATLSGLAHFRI